MQDLIPFKFIWIKREKCFHQKECCASLHSTYKIKKHFSLLLLSSSALTLSDLNLRYLVMDKSLRGWYCCNFIVTICWNMLTYIPINYLLSTKDKDNFILFFLWMNQQPISYKLNRSLQISYIYMFWYVRFQKEFKNITGRF